MSDSQESYLIEAGLQRLAGSGRREEKNNRQSKLRKSRKGHGCLSISTPSPKVIVYAGDHDHLPIRSVQLL